MGDEYLRLLGPWKQMLSFGLSTWAESPEPTRSDSHAWSAHPNYDLLTIVAGVRPVKPGFEAVVIEPHLGSLTHITAALPSPQGAVQVEYSQTANAIDATISLPTGVTGDFMWNGRSVCLHEGQQRLSFPR
jgi:alpha-L-rhamnosidase